MEYEYVCEECGNIFTKESKKRVYALKYCPECARLRRNKQNAEWRDRQREIAFGQRSNKHLNR